MSGDLRQFAVRSRAHAPTASPQHARTWGEPIHKKRSGYNKMEKADTDDHALVTWPKGLHDNAEGGLPASENVTPDDESQVLEGSDFPKISGIGSRFATMYRYGTAGLGILTSIIFLAILLWMLADPSSDTVRIQTFLGRANINNTVTNSTASNSTSTASGRYNFAADNRGNILPGWLLFAGIALQLVLYAVILSEKVFNYHVRWLAQPVFLLRTVERAVVMPFIYVTIGFFVGLQDIWLFVPAFMMWVIYGLMRLVMDTVYIRRTLLISPGPEYYADMSVSAYRRRNLEEPRLDDPSRTPKESGYIQWAEYLPQIDTEFENYHCDNKGVATATTAFDPANDMKTPSATTSAERRFGATSVFARGRTAKICAEGYRAAIGRSPLYSDTEQKPIDRIISPDIDYQMWRFFALVLAIIFVMQWMVLLGAAIVTHTESPDHLRWELWFAIVWLLLVGVTEFVLHLVNSRTNLLINRPWVLECTYWALHYLTVFVVTALLMATVLH